MLGSSEKDTAILPALLKLSLILCRKIVWLSSP